MTPKADLVVSVVFAITHLLSRRCYYRHPNMTPEGDLVVSGVFTISLFCCPDIVVVTIDIQR